MGQHARYMGRHARYAFYDLETTGINPFFDVPTQFACITTDENFNVLEEVNWRARPPSYVLPAPGALTTTGVGHAEIHSAPMSFYDLMRSIRMKIEAVQPALFVAHNGIHFDENFLRTGFYRCLHNPYLTQFGGNERLDTLILAHAVHILFTGGMSVPRDVQTGSLSFKLGRLAEANGFSGHEAHDALSDVKAMIHLTKTIRTAAPGIWELSSLWTSKARLSELCESGEAVAVCQWHAKSGKGIVRIVKPLCPSSSMPSDWIVADLTGNLAELRDKEALYANMFRKKNGKILSSLRINRMNIVVPLSHPLAVRLIDDPETYQSLGAFEVDEEMKVRVTDVWNTFAKEYEDSIHVEEQIYSGGFFPMESDRAVIERFHLAQPQEKVVLAGLLQDPRARILVDRIIAEEWPEVLSSESLNRIRKEFATRLSTLESVPWTSARQALSDIDKRLQGQCAAREETILREYRDFLNARFFDGRLAAE